MNDEEKAAYNFMTQGHAMSKHLGLTDKEILSISTTAGDIPPVAMRQYCDDYNEPYPFWCANKDADV